MATSLVSPSWRVSLATLVNAMAKVSTDSVNFDQLVIVLVDLDERIEYIKPIMFSAGIGTIDHGYIKKRDPTKGMSVAKVGGPVYR